MATPRVQTKGLEKSPRESAKMTEEQYETSTRQGGEGGGRTLGQDCDVDDASCDALFQLISARRISIDLNQPHLQ